MKAYSVRIIGMGVALAGGAAAGVPAAAAGGVQARVITVPCSSSTLIAAINTANGLGTATLRLAPSCVYAITTPANPSDALPVITGNLTIVGGPSTVIRRDSGALATFRIIEVAGNAVLRLNNISVQNGSSGDGGGIVNSGTLVLRFVTLSGNTATGLGGGLRNGPGAVVYVDHSLLMANSAGLAGGGTDNAGRLTVTYSRLTANNGANGAAVTIEGTGSSSFFRTTIDHNFGVNLGGGIQVFGPTTIDRVLIEHNRAGGNGGGILVQSDTVTATNSIVKDNTPNNCSPAGSVAGCVG